MRTTTFLLGLTLAIASCGHGSQDGYTIIGKVKNCGEWADGGQLLLVIRDEGKLIVDTANVINGHFRLEGKIEHPDFVSMYPSASNTARPNGRIIFFLENERYSITIKDNTLSEANLKGGTSEKLFREMAKHQSYLDKKYDIESIDRQMNTTLTPEYRMEKLRVIRHEYDSVSKAYKDSIIQANTPSYFSLYMTSQYIAAGENLDSIRTVLEVYRQNDKYKDDPRLQRMIEITEGKRRP